MWICIIHYFICSKARLLCLLAQIAFAVPNRYIHTCLLNHEMPVLLPHPTGLAPFELALFHTDNSKSGLLADRGMNLIGPFAGDYRGSLRWPSMGAELQVWTAVAFFRGL
jgi:hypothetical protein